MIELVCNALQQ